MNKQLNVTISSWQFLRILNEMVWFQSDSHQRREMLFISIKPHSMVSQHGAITLRKKKTKTQTTKTSTSNLGRSTLHRGHCSNRGLFPKTLQAV